MGDMSELRGLLTVGAFLGIFAFGIAMIPVDLQVASFGERKTLDYPDYFDISRLQDYNTTWMGNVDNGTYKVGGPYHVYVQVLDDGSGKFGGWDLELESDYYMLGTGMIRIYKVNYLWIFRTSYEYMTWYDEEGNNLGNMLDGDELNDSYDEWERMDYEVVLAGELTFDVSFGFNETLYSSPYQAWQYDKLYIVAGMGFDQTKTTFDSWGLIQQIMFFQNPNIHPYLNAFIALALWIPMAYVAIMLLWKAIGTLTGGG